MHRDIGFDANYRRHLEVEQRRAVLSAIGQELDLETTLGEIIDAAEALGWGERMGDLCLSDFVGALRARRASAQLVSETHAIENDDDDDDAQLNLDVMGDDDLEDAGEEVVAAKVGKKGRKAQTSTGRAGAKAAKKRGFAAQKVEASTKGSTGQNKNKSGNKSKATTSKGGKSGHAGAPSKPNAASKSGKPSKKLGKKALARTAAEAKQHAKVQAKAATKAKRATKGKASPAEDVDDEPMSLEQAVSSLLPIVEAIGKASMQELEESTGFGRRKLRFHVGQLVKHGRLKRHGMGRGTYYTVARSRSR